MSDDCIDTAARGVISAVELRISEIESQIHALHDRIDAALASGTHEVCDDCSRRHFVEQYVIHNAPDAGMPPELFLSQLSDVVREAHAAWQRIGLVSVKQIETEEPT
jgi:hypothetical protein